MIILNDVVHQLSSETANTTNSHKAIKLVSFCIFYFQQGCIELFINDYKNFYIITNVYFN